MPDNTSSEENNNGRRKFIVTSTIAASAACALFPLASGIPSVMDPATKETGMAEVPWTKITRLNSLPENGTPTKFEVILAKVRDAWTTYTNIPAGAVYLARNGKEVTAFNLSARISDVRLIIARIPTTIFAHATTVHSPWMVQ